MRRCKYPRCNEPIPETINGRKVRSDVKYCPDKNCRQLDKKIAVTKKPNTRNQIAVTKGEDTSNPTVPEGGRSAQQGEKGEIITEHNAHFKFEILSDKYPMDPEMWKPYKDPKGRATGKFTNIRVRDACGFTYRPEHRNKKPPLSVVKGKHTKFIEVHINRDSTKEKVWGLLKEVYYFLLTNMDAEIAWPPETVYWKQGPEKGKPKRDYAIESKFVENVRDKEPLLIGLQAPMRPTDEHENAKIGDGSHSFKIEVLSERLARIYAHLHGKYRHLPMEEAAEKISTEGNDVIYTREKADAIGEKVEVIDEKAERHGLSEGNISAAIYRNVKEGNAVTKIMLGEIVHTIDRAAQAIEGQTEVMGTFTRENASHTKLIQNGAEAAEDLKVAAKAIREIMGPLVDVANTIKDIAQATPPKRYDRIYKKRFRRKE